MAQTGNTNHIDKVIKILEEMKKKNAIIPNFSIQYGFYEKSNPENGMIQNIHDGTFSIKINGVLPE